MSSPFHLPHHSPLRKQGYWTLKGQPRASLKGPGAQLLPTSSPPTIWNQRKTQKRHFRGFFSDCYHHLSCRIVAWSHRCTTGRPHRHSDQAPRSLAGRTQYSQRKEDSQAPSIPCPIRATVGRVQHGLSPASWPQSVLFLLRGQVETVL